MGSMGAVFTHSIVTSPFCFPKQYGVHMKYGVRTERRVHPPMFSMGAVSKLTLDFLSAISLFRLLVPENEASKVKSRMQWYPY